MSIKYVVTFDTAEYFLYVIRDKNGESKKSRDRKRKVKKWRWKIKKRKGIHCKKHSNQYTHNIIGAHTHTHTHIYIYIYI